MEKIATFISTAHQNGIRFIRVSDPRLAKETRLTHNRKGRIPHGASREANGIAVHAFGFDELGNVVALCRDGVVRQFIR